MAKDLEYSTANEFYQLGIVGYKEAQQLEEEGRASQIQINASWNLAVGDFWIALALGHLSAPYSLCMCFNQALGVEYNEYLVKLLFGVALELGDEKCQRKINEIKIPPSMSGAIKSLTALIRETHASIPSDMKVDTGVVNSQMNKFNKAIVLPDNKIMYDLLKGPREEAEASAIAYHHQPDHTHIHYVERSELLGNNHHNDDGCCCNIF